MNARTRLFAYSIQDAEREIAELERRLHSARIRLRDLKAAQHRPPARAISSASKASQKADRP